ncbi:hypothetical protein Mapa_013509 [Marchantia paleacea]|nr:hypothetical protein Mapa_013509 [Marchantia paleacea]
MAPGDDLEVASIFPLVSRTATMSPPPMYQETAQFPISMAQWSVEPACASHEGRIYQIPCNARTPVTFMPYLLIKMQLTI